MAVLGLTEDDFENQSIEIWPENFAAYKVFNALSGAWRFRQCGMGPAIPVAIKRAEIVATLELENLPRDDWPSLFDDIKVMEQQALQVMWEE